VKVRAKVLGVPGIPAREIEVDFEGLTVADLRDCIGKDWSEITNMDGLLLAFVNGKAARTNWHDEELQPGDRVLFALPVGRP